MRLSTIYISSPVLILVLALVGCGGEESRPAGNHRPPGGGNHVEAPPVPIAVERATVGAIASTYTATATLRAEAEAEVLARVSGMVQDIRSEEGDRVGAGQVLLKIENDEYQLRVKQAEARTANLRSRFERAKKMVAKNLLSEEEFDSAVSDLAGAEADEQLAQLELSYTSVRSPFKGQIIFRLVDPGQNVSVGTPLFRVADFDPLLAEVHVPSKEFRRLETEQPVTLVLDSDGTRLQGRIKLVSPVIDPSSGTIKVTVEIASYPPATRPGDFAEVRIVTERRADRTLVPRTAVITDKGETIVFVAADGKADRRVVSIGFTDDFNSEVIEGIEPGEEIVVKGQRSLRHGQSVRILGNSPAVGGNAEAR